MIGHVLEEGLVGKSDQRITHLPSTLGHLLIEKVLSIFRSKGINLINIIREKPLSGSPTSGQTPSLDPLSGLERSVAPLQS